MRSTTAVVLALLLSHVAATAVAAAPNPAGAADLRNQAEGTLKQADGFVALAAKSQGEVAESATETAAACREVAAALQSLATAVGIGVSQEEAIETATAALDRLRKRQAAAIERLNVRQAVAGLQPAAAALEALAKATPNANKPLLEALLAARSMALAAGAALHDAITPEADPLAVEVRRDEWIRAQNDLALATRALQAANERARLAALPGADRPAAAAKLAEIAVRDEEVRAAHAAVLAATLGARLADRDRAAAAQAYADTTFATLTSLTLEQAQGWADLTRAPFQEFHDLGWCVFDSLTTISPEVADVIVKAVDDEGNGRRNPRRLSLNGLTELSPEVAAALAKHPPCHLFGYADLRLNGLKKLSPQAAEALAGHQGMLLLYGLEEIDSVPLARKLARQWGDLRLDITRLSPEIAAELAKHRGFEKATHKLAAYDRGDGAISILRLDNIESLSVETAEALSAQEGVLVLNGLESLDPAVAAALAKRVGNRKANRPGTLVLNGLPAISTGAATALAAFTGEIVLKAVKEISPETAAALAKHKGRLHLTGLVNLSPEVSAALKAHPDVLLPRPLPLASSK